jgi:hypothetical protein
VFGAAFGDGGIERLWNSDSVLYVALRKPATQLTRADAVSYACSHSYEPVSFARGCTSPFAAAGLTVMQWFGLFMTEPIVSKKKMPEDDVPMKMMTLLLELLKSNELPELAIGGAWNAIHYCLTARLSVASVSLECGLSELAVSHLNAIGRPADWISISCGKAGRAHAVLVTISDVAKCFAGQEARPDLAASVASGMFDLCLEAVSAFAAAGVDGLRDTHHCSLYQAMAVVRNTRAQPGCEDKIRGVAGSLGFCLMNGLEYMQELGITTAAAAASICETPSCSCVASELTAL